jgi:uncharacterized protein involved in exopolysaccharide biosynthesis
MSQARVPAVLDPGPRDQGHDLTFAGLLAFCLRQRKLILGCGAAAFLIVGIVAVLRPRTYTSTARFMPQSSEGNMSRLSGIAASFGVAVPGADPGSSPAFYSDLLRSRDILRRTVETRYAFAADGDSIRGTLVELSRVKGATPAIRRDAAARDLLENIEVLTSRETGTIDLEVSTPWPELSRQVASHMLRLVSEFNLNRRQTKAGAERRFVETRVRESLDSLRVAEAALEAFLQRNREYRNSPQLVFAYDRLDREVRMRQQLYTTLIQSYESARIDEVRNTPVITVMEAPDLPARPDARLALVKAVLAGIVGVGLGAWIGALREGLSGTFGMKRRGPGAGGPQAAGDAPDPTRRPGPRADIG